MVPVPHQLLGKPAPMNGFRIATVIMAGCKLELVGLFVGNTRIHLHLQIVHQVGECLILIVTFSGTTFCAAANFTGGISAVLELLFQVC